MAITMATEVYEIVHGFGHLRIPPIIEIPTYKAIAKLNFQLNANPA
jgi:hypothetical protein